MPHAETRSSRKSASAVIIRLSSFGDIVLTEPVARALKESMPGMSLVFVTGGAYARVPALFASVDRVIPYSKRGENPALEKLAAEEEFDLVLDLHNNIRSRRITRMLKAGRVLRHRKQRFLRFLSVHMPWIWNGRLKHTVETYVDALSPLGIEAGDLTPVVKPPAEALQKAGDLLPGGRWVGLCPGGSSEHKRWSVESFARLQDVLRSRRYSVAVLGSEDDRPVVEAVCGRVAVGRGQEAGPAMYVGNNTGLLAALLSRCGVTVSNDSGLMHLAVAAGSKVISIFGPTSPALGFGPAAPGCAAVSRNLECSPCSYHGNKPCRLGTRECFEGIDPEDIASLVEELGGQAVAAS
jgi:heptosyltransferase-2